MPANIFMAFTCYTGLGKPSARAVSQMIKSANRELLAIKNCLQSFAQLIQHNAIEIHTDNQNAARIIKKGSGFAVEIFQIWTRHAILLHVICIPREQNQYADYLRKITDTDDWSINNETFLYLCQELLYWYKKSLVLKVAQFFGKFSVLKVAGI